MFSCHRCILKQIAFRVGNEPAKFFLFCIDSMQDGCHGQKLKCATHEETVFRSMFQALIGPRIEGSDSETSANLIFDGIDSLAEGVTLLVFARGL